MKQYALREIGLTPKEKKRGNTKSETWDDGPTTKEEKSSHSVPGPALISCSVIIGECADVRLFVNRDMTPQKANNTALWVMQAYTLV